MTAEEVIKQYAGQWVRATHMFSSGGELYYDVFVLPEKTWFIYQIKVIFMKDGLWGY